jgi:hypothetical protein
MRNENYEKREVRVSFSVCSRLALASCPPTTGPPLHVERSSSGHFPPPRHVLQQNNTKEYVNVNRHINYPFVSLLKHMSGGEVPARVVTRSTFRGGPPTPPPQRKTRKTLKSRKIAKNHKEL